MMKKWSMIAGVTAMIICLSAEVQASPILTISDDNGNSYAAFGGYVSPGDYQVNGVSVAVGNWTVTYTAYVYGGIDGLTLSKAQYSGGGNVPGDDLVLKWTFGHFDAFAGNYSEALGGTAHNGISSATFNVLVAGNPLSGSPQSFTAPIRSFSRSYVDNITAAAGSSVTFEIDLSATGNGFISGSQTLSTPSVPDGGATMLLLGAALSVIGLARRKLQMA